MTNPTHRVEEKPRRRWRRGFAAFRATTALLITTTLIPAAAEAAEVNPTTQAKAANAAWLPYAPPPPSPTAVCLVDTGVTPNGDLSSETITRVAVDGGSPDDVDPEVRHGTRMAMIMAAQPTGEGMIGAWPRVQLVSIRAASPPAPGGRPTFAFNVYDRAIQLCLRYRSERVRVVAVELALGSAAQPPQVEVDALAERVARAHDVGISVVAAAGNDGSAVGTPAKLPGVLSVGASDKFGAFCDFTARGQGLDLLAPGCELDTADPGTLALEQGSGGTSQASAFTAAVLASLRAYKPALGWQEAEALLRGSSVAGSFDVAAAFRAAGLGAVVDAGTAAMPAPTTGPAVVKKPADTPLPPVVVAWARPVVKLARYRNGKITVQVSRRPGEATVDMQVYAKRGGRNRKVKDLLGRRNTFTWKSSQKPVRIVLRYYDGELDERSSPPTTIRKLKK